MDTLGTEIGQKMRSAVKAKLVELGTGSASGYIDDELPDYVMIMVANKRSRQQMVDDLSLFLGAQTEVFVNWLHQVLQKLQEVTLPASAATKKKAVETEDKQRKEKKRKDKKTKRRDRSTDNEEAGTDATGPNRASDGNNTPPQPTVVLPGSSITEVFANQYIEKAKKSLENAPTTKKTPPEPTAAREQRSRTPPPTRGTFELPSIAEIASAAAVRKHHKELCELEEIQQRINEAKRHLKSLGTDISDDDDEDLLHLKANEDDLEAAESRTDQPPPAAQGRSNKPLDRETTQVSKQRQRITIAPPEPSKPAQPIRSTTPPATAEPTSSKSPTVVKKRSILDRLGTKSSSVAESTEGAKSRAPEPIVLESSTKPDNKSGNAAVTGSTNSTNSTKSTIISLSAHRREEREIYVPLFRRKETTADEHSAVKDRPRHEHQVRGRSRERNNRATRSPVSRISSFRGEGNSSRNRDNNFRRGTRPEHPPVRESRARDRSRSRERSRGAGRDRSASIGRQSKNGTESVRARIGSRVIVLPPKPEFQEDAIEVPVASVIKVQPRPMVSKSKQPSKNLLLKAMAEAQRSTVADLRKTIDNTSPVDGNAPLYTRIEGKHKLLIEIPGGASINPEVELQYEGEDQEDYYQLDAAASAYPGNEPDDEEVHEVDIANQVLMEECDVDEEFKDILQSENEAEKQRAHQHDLHHAPEYAEAELEGVASATAMAVGADEDTKFVVTLDGVYKTIHDGNVSPSHTPPPPSSGGGSAKGRLSVKDRIGYKQSSNSREQSRRSPKPKDSKELEETLKKRRERFSEKLVVSSAKKSLSPPPASASRGSSMSSKQQSQPRSPKPSASSRSSHSTQSHSSSHRRTPSLSPERGPRLRHTSPLEKSSHSRRGPARNAPGSPGHLNELLLQRTKELMDDSVSSSPIYMSKSDYDKMEPSSRKRKRVSPIQFDLTDEDDMHDSEDDYHRERRARSREERNPRRSRQRDSEDRSAVRKESRRDWDRENERRGDNNASLQSPGRKIKKLESSRKFDDLPPLLSAVSVSDGKSRKGGSGGTIKDRCKYFPICRQGDACEFLHPSTPCKAFPSCKFGDKCLYLHPMCKYDLTCHRLDCNFMHTKSSSAVASSSSLAAPPLASSVVPVQNYKTISAKPLPPLCKYYPNCVNNQCPFYHPKMCRFGRLCVNKVECNFYHYELPPSELHDAPAKDKFKWISPFSA